ncbi:glycosyltransferase family A protein [Flavobacterium sp. CAN_S2]|uniref:glycosyltransferase family A protein n=1 Tax=Flavobacterium sp. CAN_S2 TaxID=2787726 RepID=UPI0018CAACBD
MNTILKNSPLISIVIPCYNDLKFIEQSVQSALNQTYENIEVILVDDGSDSATKTVLKRIEPTISTLITQDNQGQSVARNVGIRAAKGEYILVLDSDDFFEPTFCEKALPFFLKKTDIKIVTCQANLLFDNGFSTLSIPRGGTISDFMYFNEAFGSTIFKKSDWEKVNGYDEIMRKGFEDWEFYIRVVKDGGCVFVLQEVLFNYRKRNDSTTKRANTIKYELLYYIYTKHQELYKNHFDTFVKNLLLKTEREEIEKIKNTQRLEFLIGKRILQPFRWFKLFLK